MLVKELCISLYNDLPGEDDDNQQVSSDADRANDDQEHSHHQMRTMGRGTIQAPVEEHGIQDGARVFERLRIVSQEDAVALEQLDRFVADGHGFKHRCCFLTSVCYSICFICSFGYKPDVSFVQLVIFQMFHSYNWLYSRCSICSVGYIPDVPFVQSVIFQLFHLYNWLYSIGSIC